MKYILNPSAMQSVFMMPTDVVKSYLKLASADQLRVLLFTMSNIITGIDPSLCAEELQIPLEDALDALNFWCDAGIFSKNEEITFTKTPEKRETAKVETPKPSREEIAMMGQSDENIVFLLREAELKFNRPLRFTEMQTLVSLYADDGMDVAIILMIVEYAISEGKKAIGTISKIADSWINAGVDSLESASAHLERIGRQKSAWSIVKKAFGLDDRKPSEKELLYSEKWVVEWGFKDEMLVAAYNACVDANAKISMPYINKILEGWHTYGYKKPEDTKAKPKPEKTDKTENKPSYSKELFEQMLNRKD
ncbi:MAG: DnaD domain protein [Clostridia bacterium]|nr:DnaD domain protein [Clostridia bacterium]